MKSIFKYIMFVAGLVGLMILAGPVSAGEAVKPEGFGGMGLALLVNGAAIQGLFTSLKATFNKAFDNALSDWEKTTMRIMSSTKTETYAWLSRFPKMRKWIGDKVIKALEAFKYTITNEPYEATIEVFRDDIEDDTLGIYAMQAQEAGYSARTWPDELIADLKNGAFAGECYDGQYFYDSDHPVAGASVSNLGTAALSAATVALAKASYGAARKAIMAFKDDEGRPLGLIPNILEVPPALEEVGKMLCYSDKLENDTPNPYKGTAELVVNTRLTSETAWFLHVTNRPLKPFIMQIRKNPVFVSQTNMDSDDVFNKGVYKYGAEARGAAGYGLWQLSYGSTGLG